MLPAVSSFSSSSLSAVSEHTSFTQSLQSWLASSPDHEKWDRQRLAQELRAVFEQNLTEFQFRGNISSLPSCIGNLQNLKTLCFPDCTNLISLPTELGSLDSLTLLNFSYCTNLTSIPPEIGKLHNLRFLHFYECTNLASLPPELGNLENLKHLNLSKCTSLTSLPPEIGNLQNLLHLNLVGCTNLTSLPVELGNLHNLVQPNFFGCPKLSSFTVKTISLADLCFNEYKEFVKNFNLFLVLLSRAVHATDIQNESLIGNEGSSQPTHAQGHFVSDFKDRIIAKRPTLMEKEALNVTEAVAFLWEDPSVTDLERSDKRGAALPLIVLEYFLAEDARVHCLRLQQERENRFS